MANPEIVDIMKQCIIHCINAEFSKDDVLLDSCAQFEMFKYNVNTLTYYKLAVTELAEEKEEYKPILDTLKCIAVNDYKIK